MQCTQTTVQIKIYQNITNERSFEIHVSHCLISLKSSGCVGLPHPRIFILHWGRTGKWGAKSKSVYPYGGSLLASRYPTYETIESAAALKAGDVYSSLVNGFKFIITLSMNSQSDSIRFQFLEPLSMVNIRRFKSSGRTLTPSDKLLPS